LTKKENEFSKIQCVDEDAVVQNTAAKGFPLGSLWYNDYLNER
jgi:hypothetical protein